MRGFSGLSVLPGFTRAMPVFMLFLSPHTYIGNADNNFEKFLAASRDLDDRIEVVGGLIQAVDVTTSHRFLRSDSCVFGCIHGPMFCFPYTAAVLIDENFDSRPVSDSVEP